MASETFGYSGSRDEWTVPNEVYSIDVTCKGASGADGSGDSGVGSGGLGGIAETMNISVTPGETLYVRVGGAASGQSGGWNGGGDAPDDQGGGVGGGGGGSSDIRQGGDTTSDRIVIAGGGGGGGGDYSDGGDGGDAEQGGQDGGDDTATGGGAGSGGEGGSGGSGEVFGDGGADGDNGGVLSGGTGGADYSTGGGGGGGYGGGGGGGAYSSNAGGGGGGGNLGETTGVRSSEGDGEVVIEWVAQPAAPQNVSPTRDADDQITLSWETDTSGGDPDEYHIEIDRDGDGWVSPSEGPSTVTHDGSTSYSATYNPSSDSSYSSQVGIDSSFRFRVQASNDAGSSDWTSSGTVYTSPLPPHNPSVSRPDADTIAFSWGEQGDVHHGTQIYYREDTGSGYSAWDYFDNSTSWGGSVSFSVSSTSKLQTDARYQFRLRSYNQNTEFSEWAYADYGNEGNVYFEDDFESGDLSTWDATNLSDADSGVVQSDGSGDLGVSGADQGSYFLRLDAMDSVQQNLGDLSSESDVYVRAAIAVGSMDYDGEGFAIQWYDGSAWQHLQTFEWEYNKQGWVEVAASVPSSYLSTDNRLRLQGYDSLGGADHVGVDRVVVSDILHEYTAPANPSALSIDNSVEDDLTLSWTNNAAFPTKQETKLRATASSTWTHHAGLAADAATDTYTGLSDGEEYEAFARTTIEQYRRGSGGTYWYTDTSTKTAITVLPAPTILSADEVTADSVDLSWVDNHDYGDTRIEYKESDATSWTTFSTLTRGTNSETITGLLNGERYDARVVAQTEHTETEDQ